MRPKVLLVEDSTSLAVLYKQYVKDEPYDIFPRRNRRGS